VKIHRIDFGLAKIFYQEFHKTNKPPVGHKVSYVGLLGDDWNFLAYADALDISNSWLEDLHDDVRIRSDDAGDLCVYTKGQIIGVCSIGRPVARWKDPGVYEITRICFNFWPQSNKEKKYFSKFIRVAIDDFKRVEPASKFVTYIHDHQSGRYLEYAGFKKDKHIKYSENNKGWGSRQNRSSSDLSPKYRFIREVA
jgi:hypothetical protein